MAGAGQRWLPLLPSGRIADIDFGWGRTVLNMKPVALGRVGAAGLVLYRDV